MRIALLAGVGLLGVVLGFGLNYALCRLCDFLDSAHLEAK